MEGSVTAIVIRAEERKDSDYLLRLFSAEGVISAVMRGVRKASSKMKFAAQPFAFCVYVPSAFCSYLSSALTASPSAIFT